MENDSYGTTFRERMKDVMAKPAKKDFKPLNRKQSVFLADLMFYLCLVLMLTLATDLWWIYGTWPR